MFINIDLRLETVAKVLMFLSSAFSVFPHGTFFSVFVALRPFSSL